MAKATDIIDGKEDCEEIVEKEDEILKLAIHYVQNGSYPPGLSRDKERAIRKRAATVSCDKGEVFVQRKQRKVKVVTSANEHERILKACHSKPTSGHFRLTKTWKRIAERFYWKGIVSDVRQLVSIMKSSLQTSCFTLV